MAYNPALGFPTYQPIQPVYLQQPQPVQQPAQPQMPQQSQQSNINWVQGEAGEKAFLVAPNTTVALWDSEDQIIYLKSADSMGRPSVKILDYTIRNQEEKKDISPEYVTKADFEAFEEKILKKLDQRSNYSPKRYKEDRNDG